MRYRTITSILPILKLTSGRTDIDQLRPELAQMVAMVERNLGLNRETLPYKTVTLPVDKSVADLPIDFFEKGEVLDCYLQTMPPDCCTCNMRPCCCGYALYYADGPVDFTFHDCTVDCPFPVGSLTFSYYALEMGADGLPMILEGHVEAFEAYVNTLLKKGEMNAGIIHPNVYRINKEDWHEQSVITRSRDNVPSKHSVRRMAYITTDPLKFRFR